MKYFFQEIYEILSKTHHHYHRLHGCHRHYYLIFFFFSSRVHTALENTILCTLLWFVFAFLFLQNRKRFKQDCAELNIFIFCMLQIFRNCGVLCIHFFNFSLFLMQLLSQELFVFRRHIRITCISKSLYLLRFYIFLEIYLSSAESYLSDNSIWLTNIE